MHKLIVTFSSDYPDQSGSARQAEWPHFVFTCHFTWEDGCFVAFRYTSGRRSLEGCDLGCEDCAYACPSHARTTASFTQELDDVCGGDLKLEAESILRRQ